MSRSLLVKWVSSLLLALALLTFLPIDIQSIEGGYLSRKLVSRDEISNSYLEIGRSGISSSDLILGVGPSVTTLPASNTYMDGGTHATLRGSLDSLNGLPNSTIRFEWGYTSGLGTIVGSQTVTGSGTYSYTLSGYDPAATMYYRFVGIGAEGISYGSITSFQLTGGIPSTYRMAQTLPFIWVGIVIILVLGIVNMGVPPVWGLIVGGILIVISGIGIDLLTRALISWW